MKKLIYTTIALVAVAVGCTKSSIVDVPEAQKTPITFETYNGKIPVTRATEVAQDNISSIQVTGFHIPTSSSADYTKTYMNPVVSRSYNETTKAWGPWGYSPLAYWPASGSLEFVAYGSNTPRATEGEGNLIPVSGSYVNFTYTVPSDVASQKDLIAAHVASTSTPKTVELNMKHLLSRVGFKVKTISAGTGSAVTIKNITLYGTFNTKADVNLVAADTEADPILKPATDSPTTGSYSFFKDGNYFEISSASTPTQIYANKTSGATTIADTKDYYMMIMPGTVGNHTREDITDKNPFIEVTYRLAGQNADQIARITLPDEVISDEVTGNWTFAKGKAYEFIFTVSVDKIEFEGKVDDWDEPETYPEEDENTDSGDENGTDDNGTEENGEQQ